MTVTQHCQPTPENHNNSNFILKTITPLHDTLLLRAATSQIMINRDIFH